jgi:hypothetical protein
LGGAGCGFEGFPCARRGPPTRVLPANCAGEGDALERLSGAAIEFSPFPRRPSADGDRCLSNHPDPSAAPTSPSSFGEVASPGEPEGALADAVRPHPKHYRILLSPMQFMGERPGEGAASDAARPTSTLHDPSAPLHPFTPSPLHPFTPSPLHPFTPSPLHPFTPSAVPCGRTTVPGRGRSAGTGTEGNLAKSLRRIILLFGPHPERRLPCHHGRRPQHHPGEILPCDT